MLSERQLIRCELLVSRCCRRDPAAARELVTMFQKPLLFYLRRMVSSEPDSWDLSQETWLAVFRSLPSLRNTRAFPAFLYATARNTALAHLRKRRIPFVQPGSGDCPPDVACESEHEDFSSEDAARVRAALDELPLIHREVLTLHFLDELNIDDTAAVLNVPPGTVKSRLFHAKRALRVRLEN